MKFELSQRFFFEAAHTLDRVVEKESSARIHGHTYWAEVSVVGTPDPTSGMVLDLALLKAAIEKLRLQLDHHLLDEVPGLGRPTIENLCVYIAQHMQDYPLASVSVWREAGGDRCRLTLNAN